MDVPAATQPGKDDRRSHIAWNVKTRSTERPCPKSPMKLADTSRNRSADVRQREYRWKRDQNGLTSCNLEKLLASHDSQSRQEQKQWLRLARDNSSREAVNRCQESDRQTHTHTSRTEVAEVVSEVICISEQLSVQDFEMDAQIGRVGK